MDVSEVIPPHSHHLHHHCKPPSLHPPVPLIHDPQGCLRQAVMGLCQVVAAPASAPARPGPGPSTVLICSHSSSRQSVKHWGKIFCLPEQLLINCPFIDAQDKFCLLSLSLTPPSLSRLHSFSLSPCSPPHSGAHSLPVLSAPCGSVKLAHSLCLSINYRDARGAAQLARAICKRADGKGGGGGTEGLTR